MELNQKNLVKLIDRLNKYPVGLPDSPEIREFLSIFLTADEIEIASKFPLHEVSAQELANKVHWPLEKTEKILDQMAEKGTEVSLDKNFENLRIGDLLFFGKTEKRITHVALYLGDNLFIHTEGNVRVNSLTPDSKIYNESRCKTLLKAQRILSL